jgi:hypothetical protein
MISIPSDFAVTWREGLLGVLLSLTALTAYGAGADMNKLDDYQWKNRLILVQSAGETAGESVDKSVDEIDALRKARAEVDDREIVWFVNTGSHLVSNQKAVSSSLESDVKGLLEKTRSDNRVLLIGKDGGIKSRESSLNLDVIFRRIDAMPMRIREMRTNPGSTSD